MSEKTSDGSALQRVDRILFTTDFSAYSERARSYAATLARALQAEVLVFHAIAELGLPREEQDAGMRHWCQQLESRMELKLQETLDFFRRNKVRVRGELSWGAAWKLVLSLAERERVDLVVVGSHGIAAAENQLRLGTTSHRLALTCPVPLLIVRPGEETPSAGS